MSGTTVTAMEDVATRLSPTSTSVETSPVTWPFVPRERQSPPTNRLPAINRRSTLLRTSSFVKLRNFCSNSYGSFPNALLYLQTSSTALQTSINHAVIQLKECMLVLAVYLCIMCLIVQAAVCVYALSWKPTPPGLVFMVGSAVAIMSVNAHMNVGPRRRESRDRQPRRVALNTDVLKKSE